jgi:hypothetical protein|tara:strand:- start:445 stop:1512 length:1068 start_codon:yes stop_codon:yes gene_type:complete
MPIEKHNSRPENLNIEKFKLKDGSEIILIKGYGKSYGVSVDRFKNLYIPSFDRGFLYKIFPNLKDYEVFDIKENELIRVSKNESPSYKKGSFIQPHEVSFDNLNNLYVTEMGLGDGKLGGQVTKISANNKLIAKIGSDANDGKGLDGPTVSHPADDGYLYVSEWRADKIIKYNNENIIENIIGIKNKKNKNLPDCLNKPHALRLSSKKEIYIADTENHRVVKFDNFGKYIGWIGKKEDGTINKDWSAEGNSIPGSEIGAFNSIIDLEIFNNEIYVSEFGNHRITKIKLTGESVGWLGDSSENLDKLIWNINGQPVKSDTLVGLNNPFGLRILDKILYVADKNNGRIKIIKSNLFN